MIRQQITDKRWNELKAILEKIRDGRGKASVQSEREFLEAVLWIARTGSPWRDLPAQLGHWHNVYVRFRRWEKAGIWFRLWEEIQHKSFSQARALFIDTTIIRAHQHASGAQKKTPLQRLSVALEEG